MLVKILSSSIAGVAARLITIEVSVSSGIRYYIVGLPDVAVKESLQRIESAVNTSGFRMPRQKIVVNLAPAYIRKEGSAFDLAITLGILAASNQLDPGQLTDLLVLGELSLGGDLLPVRGVLSMALLAKEQGLNAMIVPAANASEAAIVEGIEVFGLRNLTEAVFFIKRRSSGSIQAGTDQFLPHNRTRSIQQKRPAETAGNVDFSDVKGQAGAKRALEIAAAGGHNVLMFGPPGAGKSMLARLLPTILPSLTYHEMLETTQLYSAAGKLPAGQDVLWDRPFRAPHHTISVSAFGGGGSYPYPGEISLAHNGVLFLDELPEFRRHVLEVLRQPLESRAIAITRAKVTTEFPADFILVAAMNPCPCGFYNHPTKACTCLPRIARQYMSRISGPLLDRIDMHIDVHPVSFDELNTLEEVERSSGIRERVIRAQQIQEERYGTSRRSKRRNAHMDHHEVKIYSALQQDGKDLLRIAMERLNLSARAYNRILKVARTIADLDGASLVETAHVAEAVQYRGPDRDHWTG